MRDSPRGQLENYGRRGGEGRGTHQPLPWNLFLTPLNSLSLQRPNHSHSKIRLLCRLPKVLIIMLTVAGISQGSFHINLSKFEDVVLLHPRDSGKCLIFCFYNRITVGKPTLMTITSTTSSFHEITLCLS